MFGYKNKRIDAREQKEYTRENEHTEKTREKDTDAKHDADKRWNIEQTSNDSILIDYFQLNWALDFFMIN